MFFIFVQADGSLLNPAKILHSGGNLSIINLGKEDRGVYECVAASVVSSVITSSLLIIECENLFTKLFHS